MRHTSGSSSAMLIAVAAIGLSVFGVLVSLVNVPALGVRSDGTFVQVQPGSPAWLLGVRPGDTELAHYEGLHAGGLDDRYLYQTNKGQVTVGMASVLEEMKGLTEPAVLGVIAALVGAALALRGLSVGLAAAGAGAMLAALPLLHVGNLAFLLLAALGTTILAGGAVFAGAARRTWPRGSRIVLAALGLAIGGWVVGAFLWSPVFDAADAFRGATLAGAIGFATLGSFERAKVRSWLAELRLVDIAFVGILTAVTGALLLFVRLPPLLVVLLVVVALALYPAARRLGHVVVDRTVMSDLRGQASIQATETERTRLARDLHDAPLQDLAGVIRRLDVVPEAGAEADTLRQVAQQLRDVAIRLRPPILEDLGLGAALPALTEIYGRPGGPTLDIEIDDLTDHRPENRPTEDVELAVYRIVQEAVSNAMSHSRGSRVAVRGVVSSATVDLTITDDGVGLETAAVPEARRRGHFGVDTMRQRAAGVGATLIVGPRPGGGTVVHVTWG